MALDLRGERALVTGATGFLGAHLALALAASGAEVHVLVRETSDPWRLAPILGRLGVHVADVTDARRITELVARIRPTVVVNAAVHRGAGTDRDDARTHAVSVEGVTALLEAARDVALHRFLHLGSSLEYGATTQPVAESALLTPHSVHGTAKAAAAEVCLRYARDLALPIVIVRPFSLYGPLDQPHRLIPTAIRAALRGIPLRLTRAGFSRDWLYVDDVVEACLRAVRTPGEPGETYNVGSGRTSSNEAIVREVERATGCPIAIDPQPYQERPWDTSSWVADTSKAQRLLGWRPHYGLAAGIGRTVAWYRARPQQIEAS